LLSAFEEYLEFKSNAVQWVGTGDSNCVDDGWFEP
jgi:hypothetical protein